MLNPHDWTTLQPHFETLETEIVDALNAASWLQRWSDLERALYEAFSRAYRAKQEDTTSQTAEDAYLNLVENVVPHVKVAQNRLEQKLAALPESALPEDALELLKRTRASLEIFREANVALETELSKLGVEYDKIVGDFSIDLHGEELTLYGALAKLQEPDRDVRETVYRALVNRWRQDREKLENLFMQMLRLRRQVAQNAGFADYRAFIWKAKARFDYTPEDCLTLHDSILEHIVPVLQSEMDTHRASLGLDTLKPWDVDVDSANRAPLKPFSNIHELEAVCRDVFAKLDPDLGEMFGTLMQGDLDLESRKGKGPGGYCDFHPQSGKAYIFMNAVGTHDDVQTLLHEGGHAFHALESAHRQRLYWNLHGPMEFCEVASMGMEMLAQPYLEKSRGGFYTPEDAHRARRDQLLDAVVKFLPYMAVVDAFQHWLYVDAPLHVTIDDINARWAQLFTRFLPHVNYDGIEDGLAFRWQRQSHIFDAPFYYIEYGIAQLGAVQVWRNATQDEARAVKQYRQALSLGYTKGLRDLFEAAGIELAFTSSHVAGLTKLVQQHL
jgi:oligoendopeptidase F